MPESLSKGSVPVVSLVRPAPSVPASRSRFNLLDMITQCHLQSNDLSAHHPGSWISQQRAPFTEPYISLAVQASPNLNKRRRLHALVEAVGADNSEICVRCALWAQHYCRLHSEPRRYRAGNRPTAPRFSTSSRSHIPEGCHKDGKACRCRICHLRCPQRASSGVGFDCFCA